MWTPGYASSGTRTNLGSFSDNLTAHSDVSPSGAAAPQSASCQQTTAVVFDFGTSNPFGATVPVTVTSSINVQASGGNWSYSLTDFLGNQESNYGSATENHTLNRTADQTVNVVHDSDGHYRAYLTLSATATISVSSGSSVNSSVTVSVSCAVDSDAGGGGTG